MIWNLGDVYAELERNEPEQILQPRFYEIQFRRIFNKQ